MRKLLAFFLLCSVAVGAWLASALWLPLSPGGQTFVVLHPGYSTRRVARTLKAAGVIRSSEAFVLWHAFHRKPLLKAGEYLFDHDSSAVAIHNRLAKGDVYVHTVVIPTSPGRAASETHPAFPRIVLGLCRAKARSSESTRFYAVSSTAHGADINGRSSATFLNFEPGLVWMLLPYVESHYSCLS